MLEREKEREWWREGEVEKGRIMVGKGKWKETEKGDGKGRGRGSA